MQQRQFAVTRSLDAAITSLHRADRHLESTNRTNVASHTREASREERGGLSGIAASRHFPGVSTTTRKERRSHERLVLGSPRRGGRGGGRSALRRRRVGKPDGGERRPDVATRCV